MGIPHPAGGTTDAHPDAERFWFYCWDGPGPLLIGMDYLETYKCVVDHHRGLMLVGGGNMAGTCWALERMPSGHWGFNLMRLSRKVELSKTDGLLTLATQKLVDA